jgi:hypothetical protein
MRNGYLKALDCDKKDYVIKVNFPKLARKPQILG